MPENSPNEQTRRELALRSGENSAQNALRNLTDANRTTLIGQLEALGISFSQFEALLQAISFTNISGGVNISGNADVGGDVVGRDKVESTTHNTNIGGGAFIGGSATADHGGSVVGRDNISFNFNLAVNDRDLLRRSMPAMAAYPALQEPLYAALRATASDLELDYAALAHSLHDKQKRNDPLAVAEREKDVYVPLALKFSRHRRVSAQALFEQDQTFNDVVEAVEAARAAHDAEPYPALVLLGMPGGGKSTALRQLALDRLKHLLSDSGAHLPLFVSLGEYHEGALSKLRRALNEDDLPLTPLNFLRAHWHRWFGDDGFERALDTGRLWLILDGLNEIPDRDNRIPDWAVFFDLHAGIFVAPNRAVIACRRADYGNRLDLPYLDLELLDLDRIRDFVGKRLQLLGQRAIDDVLRRLEKDAELLEVVSNPFWLKMLTDYAEDHAGHMPEGRTDLIDWFVDKWLQPVSGRADLPPLSPDEIKALKMALEPLAYWLLGQGDNTPIDWTDACEHCGAWPGHSTADTLRRAEAASLLVSDEVCDERSVKFYHQLLLEYFAGRELARRFKRGEPLTDRWRIPWQNWKFVHSEWQRLSNPPTTRWEEATVFAAARPMSDLNAFTNAVLMENPPLAARCLLEAGKPVPDQLRQAVIDRLLALVERRDPALRDIAEPSAQLSLHIAAGHALGKMGDTRIVNEKTHGRVMLTLNAVKGKHLAQTAEILRRSAAQNDTRQGIEFIEPMWCPVKAEPFKMGSNTGYDNEKPEHTCDVIKADYAIGLFPVTNTEYECFVKAGGFDNKDYWTPQGWNWRTLDISTAQTPGWVFWRRDRVREMIDEIRQWPARGIASPSDVEFYEAESQRTDEELIANWRERELSLDRSRNPWRDDRDLNGANQPVVGVCWHEALAYCAWLTEVLRAARRIKEDQAVTLPNEPEWEKAARGGDDRVYPWGKKEFETDRANTLDGRVLTTTPVGIYDNASPCAALDMSGNVWEWTRSRWGDDPQRPTFGYPYSKDLKERERLDADDYRVARGGSWRYVASSARCACRSGNSPDYRSGNRGFRCVLQFSIA